MVVPTKELANTLFSSSITALQTLQMAHIPSFIGMNINSSIIRGRSASSNRKSSRKSSILSKALSMAYHKYMEVMNTLLSEDIQDLVDSLQLFYASNNKDVEKDKLVSEVTNNSLQKKTLYVTNEAPARIYYYGASCFLGQT